MNRSGRNENPDNQSLSREQRCLLKIRKIINANPTLKAAFDDLTAYSLRLMPAEDELLPLLERNPTSPDVVGVKVALPTPSRWRRPVPAQQHPGGAASGLGYDEEADSASGRVAPWKAPPGEIEAYFRTAGESHAGRVASDPAREVKERLVKAGKGEEEEEVREEPPSVHMNSRNAPLLQIDFRFRMQHGSSTEEQKATHAAALKVFSDAGIAYSTLTDGEGRACVCIDLRTEGVMEKIEAMYRNALQSQARANAANRSGPSGRGR